MKAKRKIWILLFLPLLLLLAADRKTEAAEVSDAETGEILVWGDFSYQKDGQEITICGYSGEESIVMFPETIDGLPVTAIGERAFYENEQITSVTIGANIKDIGISAFARSSLGQVVFEDGTELLTVENSAFYHCESLFMIDFGSREMTLGYSAFGCANGLTELFVPETVKLTSGEYGNNAFYGSSSLQEVEIWTETVETWMFHNCSALRKVVLGESVRSIGKSAFGGCASLTDITLSEGLTSIGYSAFYGCSTLVELTLPESLETIEEYAFQDCSLLGGLTIPAKVTTLYCDSFRGCSSMASLVVAEDNPAYSSEKNVIYDKEKTRAIVAAARIKGTLVLPDTLRTIGEKAFYQCSRLENVTLPEGLITIEEDAFYECASLQRIVIPDSVQGTLDGTFQRCSALVYAKVGTGVTALDSTFILCTALEEVELGENVLDLGYATFSSCSSLKKINIPEGVTAFEWFLFYRCERLEALEIPRSLQSVGFRSLEYCSTLESLTFYENLRKVDNIWYAMADNENLQYVFFMGPYVELSDNVFENMNAGFVVFYRPAYSEWTQYTKYPTVAVTDEMLSLKENLKALDINKIRLTDKERLQDYKEVYEGLTNQEQLFYLQRELDVLQKCQEKIKALEVGVRIDALPDPEQLVPEDKTEVRAVNREYQALTSEMKLYLTPAQTLRIAREMTALTELLTVKRLTFEAPAKKLDGEYHLTLVAGENAGIPVTVYPDYAEDKKLDAESDGQDVIVSAQIPEEEARLELTAVAPGNAVVTVRHRDVLEISLNVKVNLAAPENVKAEQQGESSVKITWDRVENASRYAIYRTIEGGTEKLRAFTSGNLGIHVDTDLTPGTTYSYRIVACLENESGNFDSEKSQQAEITLDESPQDGTEKETQGNSGGVSDNNGETNAGGTGDSSSTAGNGSETDKNSAGRGENKTPVTTDKGTDQVSVQTGNQAAEKPAAPSGVKAVRYGKNAVKLTWKKSKGVSGYEIYRSTKKAGKYKKIKTVKKAATKKYINRKLKSGIYYYRIRCYKTVGGKKIYSKYSKRVKVKIK